MSEKLEVKMKRFLFFNIYNLLYNILFSIMEFLPSFIRMLLFRLFTKEMGKGNIIDYKCYLRFPKKIIIGNNVSINRGTNIIPVISIKDAYIIFRNNIAVGPNVVFIGGGHDYTDLTLPVVAKSIIINDNCWIGAGSTILPGVELGEGVIIGASSVVTKSIPPYSIAVGNPAKVIKQRVIK